MWRCRLLANFSCSSCTSEAFTQLLSSVTFSIFCSSWSLSLQGRGGEEEGKRRGGEGREERGGEERGGEWGEEGRGGEERRGEGSRGEGSGKRV